MPIAPIMMIPAYRYGDETPWGGEGLRTFLGKKIPDERTGESLEVSAIPGLESRDEKTGRTLPELIALYGDRLTGKGFSSPFPLLIKLLATRDRLSVQVHPDDAYAARAEHKLGKTEAWHILHAEPDTDMVYGVKAGTTREALLAASLAGRQVEEMLRIIPVRAGETYYIPAGTVHDMGRNAVIYEVQESSDVTYRFYDWNRVGKDGKKRELHIQKAVDVARTDRQLSAAKEEMLSPGRFLLVREKHFMLERFDAGAFSLPRDERRFALLTAVRPCALSWAEGNIALPAGRTAFLPADGYDLTLTAGQALLAYPA